MKTIILCGGYGYRLREETEFRPKPMVLIGDKPIVWHIMKIYSHFGYNEFILALGYKAEYIKNYFLNQKVVESDFYLDTKTHKTKFYLESRREKDKFKITFVDTGLNTLPGERIIKCKKYLKNDENFMVTYGDAVTDLNIKELVSFHLKQKTIGTITGIHQRSRFGIIKLKNNNLIEKFREKPVVSDWVNGGFMVFQKKIFKYLKNGETEHPALQRIAASNNLSLYKHEGFWFCMDTYREYEELNKIYSSGKPPWKIW